jgi:hypothetical protein
MVIKQHLDYRKICLNRDNKPALFKQDRSAIQSLIFYEIANEDASIKSDCIPSSSANFSPSRLKVMYPLHCNQI